MILKKNIENKGITSTTWCMCALGIWTEYLWGSQGSIVFYFKQNISKIFKNMLCNSMKFSSFWRFWNNSNMLDVKCMLSAGVTNKARVEILKEMGVAAELLKPTQKAETEILQCCTYKIMKHGVGSFVQTKQSPNATLRSHSVIVCTK